MTTHLRFGSRLAAAFLMALAAFATPALGGDRPEFKREFSKDLPLPAGKRLAMEHAHGDINVTTHKEREVRIRAVIRVSSSDIEGAEQFSKEIAIDVETLPEGVLVRTRYPKKSWVFKGRGYISYSVDYEIGLPMGAGLDIRSKFGNITASGLDGATSLRNANGTVAVRQSKGPLVLENAFGNVEVTGYEGDTQIVASNGTVSVATLRGGLDAKTRFGRVSIRGVSGKSLLVGSNGNVDIEDCGSVEVTNSFGDVRLRGLKGDAVVRNSNGKVSAQTVGGSADLETSFGSVDFTDIKKRVSVTASNAKVIGSRTGEPVKVANSFGPVEIREVPGVEIVNSNGKVFVRDIRGPASLTTSFAMLDAMGIGRRRSARDSARCTRRGSAARCRSSRTTARSLRRTWTARPTSGRASRASRRRASPVPSRPRTTTAA
jgi:DUF4097 and DUF4098 domain-containing protein YvlB